MLAELSWERRTGERMEAEQGEGRHPRLVWAGKPSQPCREWGLSPPKCSHIGHWRGVWRSRGAVAPKPNSPMAPG